MRYKKEEFIHLYMSKFHDGLYVSRNTKLGYTRKDLIEVSDFYPFAKNNLDLLCMMHPNHLSKILHLPVFMDKWLLWAKSAEESNSLDDEEFWIDYLGIY